MPKLADTLLRTARVAELRTSVTEVAALCQRPAPVALAESSSSGHRRLLLLLARERRRNAKLVELISG